MYCKWGRIWKRKWHFQIIMEIKITKSIKGILPNGAERVTISACFITIGFGYLYVSFGFMLNERVNSSVYILREELVLCFVYTFGIINLILNIHKLNCIKPVEVGIWCCTKRLWEFQRIWKFIYNELKLLVLYYSLLNKISVTYNELYLNF